MTIKKNRIILNKGITYNGSLATVIGYCILVIGLVACSTDNEPDASHSLPLNPHSSIFNYTMHLDGGMPTSYTTRSSATWTDGSVIYLRFLTEDDEVTGTAVYNAATDTWTVKANGEIGQTTEELGLTAYYFDGETTVSEEEGMVLLTPQTGVYSSEGIYTHPTATDIHVKTTLLPLYWRMNFRGTEGQTVTIVSSMTDIDYPSFYDINYGDIAFEHKDVTLTVGSNGCTPYIYGWLANTDENTLYVTTDADYKRIIKSEDIASGNSVYCQLPTADNYQAAGWEKND